jgi:hypothetical protein
MPAEDIPDEPAAIEPGRIAAAVAVGRASEGKRRVDDGPGLD